MAKKKTQSIAPLRPVPRVITRTPISNVSEDHIELRAYAKWLARGCPSGDDKRDWFEAQAELQG